MLGTSEGVQVMDFDSLQRSLEQAKLRRFEALRRHGVDSPQFAAAHNHVTELEAKIREAAEC